MPIQNRMPFDIYEHSADNKYRYALGTRGERTLFCLGVNPSTADDVTPDTTIRKVHNIVYREGKARNANFGGIFNRENFDSFVMLNIYPFRETKPANLPAAFDRGEHEENVDRILRLVPDNSVIWAAWGDPVQKRRWLEECLNDIIAELNERKNNIRWVKMGKLNDTGEPPHPLSRVEYQPFTPYGVNERRNHF